MPPEFRLAPDTTLVVVVGQGYIGLPLAVRAAEVGFRVVGIETDPERLRMLRGGESFIDDVATTRLRAVIQADRYAATNALSPGMWFDVAVITVPTPLANGAPDLSSVEQSASALAHHLRRGSMVILESTTYPGTTEQVVRPLLESISGLTAGRDFFLGYSPERIDPGNGSWCFENTPKVVAGFDAASLARVDWFYRQLVERTVPVESLMVAELSKLVENTFRHANIALINELAMYAHELGIDVWEAIRAAATKPFGFMSFTPGPGVGGHCLPVDPSYLSWHVRRETGHVFRFIDLANKINAGMPLYVARRVQAIFTDEGLSLDGRRILLLGFAYKKNSSDARESPTRALSAALRAGGAVVAVADPHVNNPGPTDGFEWVDASADEMRRADLAVIVVDHDAFDYHALANNCARIFDCRNRLRLSTVHRL